MGVDNKKLHILQQLQTTFSSGLFEDLVENFPDIIHSVNKDGRIVSTNRKAEELLSYTKSELIGMPIFDLYAEEVQNQLRSGFEKLKKSGYSQSVESKLKAKDGEIIDVEIRSISLYDSENNFDRTFSIIRDIREKKSIQAQLYQQSKLAGIGELAAGIIHDIRNPLAVIKGFASKGISRAVEKKDFESVLKLQSKILKASDRIDRLCSHLRDYMRQEHELPEPTILKTLVEDCLLICENRASTAGAKIVNEVTDPDFVATLPSNSVEQVLINIVSNACDAVSGCELREVRVRARKEVADASTNKVVFEVEDTGPGVPAKVAEKIFESFFTTKPKGKGTGLGLSICAGLVEEHGGKLSIDSSYTDGARFVIEFPTETSFQPKSDSI